MSARATCGVASSALRPPGHVTRAHAGGRQARAEIRLLVADTIQPVVAFASNPRDGQIVYTSVFRASDCSNNFTCIIEKYVTGFDDLRHMFLKYVCSEQSSQSRPLAPVSPHHVTVGCRLVLQLSTVQRGGSVSSHQCD